MRGPAAFKPSGKQRLSFCRQHASGTFAGSGGPGPVWSPNSCHRHLRLRGEAVWPPCPRVRLFPGAGCTRPRALFL